MAATYLDEAFHGKNALAQPRALSHEPVHLFYKANSKDPGWRSQGR
ncbi:MAG TPA: hypothetical protein VJ945_01720 [Flavobacteriaceae bacterium]|nr:hypothetical protein [Flavobacteriaceae bacterium]